LRKQKYKLLHLVLRGLYALEKTMVSCKLGKVSEEAAWTWWGQRTCLCPFGQWNPVRIYHCF